MNEVLLFLSQAASGGHRQMNCLASLLTFYKHESNKRELFLRYVLLQVLGGRTRTRCLPSFVRYVYKLYDLHVAAENFSEAGVTLKLHADTLNWTNRTLHADLRYPSQKEWERKEALLTQAADLLEKGKDWERAVPILRDLSSAYEHVLHDYGRLAATLRRQAELFERMASPAAAAGSSLRLQPEYFRVAFRGRDFPAFLRVRNASEGGRHMKGARRRHAVSFPRQMAFL